MALREADCQSYLYMRKNVFGRQLKRDANERKALFKNLLTSLVMHERITTTVAKAKAINSSADKLVTTAKKGGLNAYRNLEPQVNHDAVVKLIDDIAPRFTNRQGGYTRIIKTRRRVADNAPMAILEWTEQSSKPVAGSPKKIEAGKKEKRAQPKKTVKKVEKKTKKKANLPAGRQENAEKKAKK